MPQVHSELSPQEKEQIKEALFKWSNWNSGQNNVYQWSLRSSQKCTSKTKSLQLDRSHSDSSSNGAEMD
jgi:hypothetical protein